MNSPRVCVVTLNFNGLVDTLACLESLRQDRYANKEIVVIDNGSTDDSAIRIRKAFPEVTLIVIKSNLGFTGGNNVGLKHAQATGAKYLYWLNNDTTSEPDAITQLVETAEANPRFGILTPLIHYFDRPEQPWFAGSILDLSRGVAVHDNAHPPTGNVQIVPWISGCAMFTDVSLMAQLGGFDDRFFLYWEDVDLSLRVKQAGRELALVPAARVYHKVSRTASAYPGASRYYYVRNNLLLLRSHRAAAGFWATPRVLFDRFREAFRDFRRGRGSTSLRMTSTGILDHFLERYGKRKWHGRPARVPRPTSTGETPVPLRIAMTSYYLPSDSKIGVGFQAHYMANAMIRRGHRVTMFSPCPPCDDALYEHHRVDVGRHLRTFNFALQLRHADFSKFDVLHAHGDDYWLWRRRVACHVKTMHGSCLEEARNIPKLKEKIRMLALAAGEMLGSVVADQCVAVSRNTTRAYRWIDRVIPNGVDHNRFKPGSEKESQPTILFVGTYRNRKRGKMLMDVFRREIRPAVPDARLWMVCNDAPTEPGVEVLGKVPLDQLADLYRRAWVFCLPSSYEGFGVPYIEAMASGTPVVATPNVGAREVLQDGRYGVIANPSDLGAAIVRLLNDPQERSRWSRLGLERASEFAWDVVLEQYERVYEEVMQGHRRH